MRRWILGLSAAAFTAVPLTAQDVPKPKPAAPATSSTSAKAVAVPFKLLPSRHMLIELTLNGKGPFRVIFDTGAPLNLVNNKLARAAGLKTTSGFSLFSGGLKSIDIDTVKLGDVSIQKMPVVVMDHPTVQAISDAFTEQYGTIDGIVGFPLFSRFNCTVDYQAKTLNLAPNDYKPGDYIADLTRSMTEAGEQSGKPKPARGKAIWGFTPAAKDDDDTGSGFTVKSVLADGPMARAGIQAGDLILTIDGRWTDSLDDAYTAASLVKPGTEVEVKYVRDRRHFTVKVTPVKGF